MYNATVRDHFLNPRNVGDLENPDASGEAANASDGDRVQLQLRIRDGFISDVRFRVMGCVAAIAAASCLSEMLIGKSPEEAAAISKTDLVQKLGGLPEAKIKCSLTCINALHAALKVE
ncbi:iron-sulfur cluster assembly scaffold protein [bacterium]|nr:iron-sulfur cluster assembly scaffold protein [bacterium]